MRTPFFAAAVEHEDGSTIWTLKVGPYIAWACWSPTRDDGGLIRGCGFLLGPLSWRLGDRDPDE